jgi:uncharacterized membrane-anchored protein YhcB (DUF1043 family)
MEPLAFVAAILGAGGLGVILKIVLGASGKQQTTFQKALEQQRASYQRFLENQRQEFESFLGNHMSATAQAMENLVRASDRLGDKLSDEHEETRQLIRDQARIVRDGHRRLGQLLQTNRATAKAGRALDEVMAEIEEKNHGR